ncbi:MAG TPA: GNAT family N-acetyltransferase [Thermoanaerobaculia bacterium]|nr:GNAT family N-acetyltransferase [Thermoanaerobaculia bacterium]
MDVDYQDFERSVVVRPMTMDDFDRVLALQAECFPGAEPWSREMIASQLRRFPEGQLVVELDGRVVASSSSLVVDFDEYADGHSWHQIADQGFIRNHDPDGDTLYGIEIMVDPALRGRKLARRLYQARKELCRELNLKRIVIGGRIPGYQARQGEMTAREYVDRVLEHQLFDPVLTVQIKSGFSLKRLIRSYLDEDVESDGWATLLEWVNLDYRLPSARRLLASRPVRLCVVQYGMREIASFEDFAQQCTYFVDVASGYRSDFVLFPELLTTQLLCLWPHEKPAVAVRKLAGLTEQYLDLFSRLAIAHDVNIVGGSHFTLEDEKLYNVSYLFQRNGEIGKQYKLHVTPSERMWWGVQPGRRLEVFDTDKGKVSIQICYDVEFPEISRLAVERGARIVFVPFCTDERQGYLRVRYCAQARCIENQVYSAISGTVGNLPVVENMDIQYAQSGIFTPSDFSFSRDAVGAECTPNIETVVIHDVDLELLERFRQKGTVRNWIDRRTDLYEVRLREDAGAPEPQPEGAPLGRPLGG